MISPAAAASLFYLLFAGVPATEYTPALAFAAVLPLKKAVNIVASHKV
jgi:hypothetical protein